MTRRTARKLVLAAIYAQEMRGGDLEEVLSDPLVNFTGSRSPFVIKLLGNIMHNKEAIDDYIRSRSDKWELHRIALMDMLIMRISIAEMLYLSDVPPVVSINEAIEIAKLYSTERSGRFINGILDSVKGDIDAQKSKIIASNHE